MGGMEDTGAKAAWFLSFSEAESEKHILHILSFSESESEKHILQKHTFPISFIFFSTKRFSYPLVELFVSMFVISFPCS